MRNLHRRLLLFLALTLALPSAVLAEEKQSQSVAPVHCKFEIVNAHADNEEGQQILTLMQGLLKNLEENDFNSFGEALENDASMFDAKSNELVIGKDKIIAKLKERLGAGSEAPLTKFEIRDAYVLAKKDSGTVTFQATKEYGGDHPYKMVSYSSNVFQLKEGKWKIIHFRSAWKKA